MNKRFGFFVKILVSIAVFVSIPMGSYALDANRKELENGLVVLHAERTNLPMVVVNLLIKASPLDEPADKAGLASMVASMLTEGTKRRTSSEISDEIEFIGGSLVASATEDDTVLSLTVLKKDIEKGFDLLSDVLLNPQFPDEELARKKVLVKGALRQSEEEPEYLAEKAFGEAVYGKNPYGRPVPGTKEGIDALSRDDLRAFHSAYYVPNNSILTVVGDLTEKELDALIENYLSSWRKSDVPPRKAYGIEEQKGVKIIRIDRDLTQANIVLGYPGISRLDPDYYAASVMNYIFGGGGFSSRLMQKIRDEMGLTYGIFSYFDALKYGGTFKVSVQTKNEAANTVVDVTLKEMERIRSELVSEDELKDAISYLTGSFPRRLETMSKVAGFLSAVEFLGLGLDYDREYIEIIKKITREDVLRVAKKYLHPENYVLVVVANQKLAKVRDR